MISVHKYVEGKFVITATPYLIATYKDTDENITVNRFALDCFTRSFNVITKKGASAVNADRTQIDMMPSDEPSNLELKISTDDQVKELHFEIIDITSASGTNNATYVEGLDILFKNEKQTGSIDISSIDVENVMQTVNLTLRLNKNSHYIEQGYILQVRFYVLNGDKQIEEIIHINVLPQIISSVIPLNYRMEDGETEVNFKNAYESGVIRPGSTNIITIDIVPNIAVYDYVEVRDITGNDKILFQQVDEKLQSLENMDSWVDNGIKLIKVKENDSRLYLIAKLPLNSTYNITHTIQITIYHNVGEPIVTNLSLEAIMYPTIVMTYNDPTGKQIAKADTREGSKQEIEQNANLALGVEAPISVEAYNIDEGSLQNSIKITNAESNEVANSNYVYLDYIYGKYVLRFNTSSKTAWVNLLGCNISVTFTASKHLNGITETCKATITFTIREVVVHGVSMTHSTIQDGMEKLYGDWSVISDEGNIEYWFETQFYFDRNDISFYNNGYWNVKYNLDNTANIYYINRILKDINSLTNGVELYLGEENITNIVKSSNGYVGKNFIIKHEADRLKIMAYKDSDINNMKLSINFTFGYEGNNPILKSNGDYTISEEFGFIITDKSTPFDQYLKVSTPEEFVNMIEGKYYQLVNDITFDDEYTPLNTAISALNGNGYTITIKKFNVSQLVQDYVGGGMYIGLFGTQTENTIIQNLQVKYEDVIVSLIENETIKEQYSNEIFYGGISAINLGVITNVNVEGTFRLLNEIVPSAQIDLGGITASNGSAQSTKLATITNSTSAINLNSIALIGGVAGTNYGKITNTVFSGTISNMNMDSTGNAFASTVFTAGFVVENIAGANISLSYVDCDNTSNTTINSVGNTAGFVYNNAGTINNSYIVNTSIKSQGNIAGFAYQSSGTIDCCYSYTTIPSSLFYQEFIYLTSNVGSLSNCYVITDSSRTITISGLKAIKISESSNKDKYQGFVLTDNINGVWIMRENYPVILSAGVELLSDHDYTNIYNIYDVETYQGYFDMFITTSGETSSSMLDKTFRIVRNIDFANTQIGNPMTSNINLIANLEGNDMEISNYSIYKDGTIENIGLFATINRDVYVRNLILKPESIKATSGKAVGALAGEIDGAYIFNIKIDNNSLLILGKNSVGGLAGLIKGAFEIAGINSNVSAFATYKYNTANQYNLYTGKNVTGSEVDNLDIVSYAGSIAGIINGYNENALFSASNRNKENYSKIYHLKVEGSLVLIGETVGALFGLVGEQTFVYNSSYIVEEETQYQAEFVSGGLVGENRGVVQNCNITPSNISLSANENCFKYNATVNGGIAGLNIGGLINNCSSSLNITNNHTTATVGGIVGRNIEGLVWECSIDAYMSGFYAGGIVGTDYSYSTIIKIKTGYGTATDASVYKNIKSTVSYKASNNEDENTPFIGNKISKQFIQNFLNVSKTYYQFNSGYVTGEELNLVNADKAFGLFIGVTDRVNVKVDNVVYGNNILTATISSGDNPIRYSDYILEYNGLEEKKKYSVEAVTDIVDGTFNLSGLYIEGGTPATFVYLVAKEGVAYEGWSPALGYGKQRVIIASNSFGTWIESEAFITGNSYEDNTYLVLVNDVYIAVNNLYYTADNLKTEDESATKGFGYYDKETLEVTLVADGTKLYKWQ
ncbi:MAG: hypothetical protein IJA72_01425 [Clostridia bacterium]|nr:hypothetical protein [Clostridia bacterium]